MAPALVAVGLWTSVISEVATALDDALLGDGLHLLVVSGVTVFVGLVGGSIAYARLRGLGLRLGRPDAEEWPTALSVVAGPALLAVAVAAVANLGFGVTMSAMDQH